MDLLPLVIAVGLAILFLILFVLTASHKSMPKTTAKAPFGIITDVDAVSLNECGPSKTDVCEFTKTSVSACEAECNLLESICSSFSFDQQRNLMKIVDPSTLFASIGVNVFMRQAI